MFFPLLLTGRIHILVFLLTGRIHILVFLLTGKIHILVYLLTGRIHILVFILTVEYTFLAMTICHCASLTLSPRAQCEQTPRLKAEQQNVNISHVLHCLQFLAFVTVCSSSNCVTCHTQLQAVSLTRTANVRICSHCALGDIAKNRYSCFTLTARIQ